MKILVTGTGGFIGFHVAQALMAQGHQVVGVDNFNDYYPTILKRRRAEILEKNSSFHCVEMSLGENEKFLDLVKAEKVERICHLAAQAGVRYSLEYPFTYQEANLHGFLSVLEATRHAGLERLVYASSSSVYGGNTKLPFSELDPVDHPISLYAATKRANELMAHTYTHLYGFESVGLRFFTVYGPWGRPDMAMWLFSEAILHGKPIKVFNNGDMQRDFTYIDDIVSGVLGSLFSDKIDKYEILNLGNNEPEQLMDMIGRIGECMGKAPEMEMLPMQPGDVAATYADISRAQEKVDFSPKTPMREGVANFVQWFKDEADLVEQIWQEKLKRNA